MWVAPSYKNGVSIIIVMPIIFNDKYEAYSWKLEDVTTGLLTNMDRRIDIIVCLFIINIYYINILGNCALPQERHVRVRNTKKGRGKRLKRC